MAQSFIRGEIEGRAAYQKRSSLITVGTSQGFALSFAFLSAASHRWRVHSSATMVSATLNFPCVGQSKPVAWPVWGSSCAGDLQIGQTIAITTHHTHLLAFQQKRLRLEVGSRIFFTQFAKGYVQHKPRSSLKVNGRRGTRCYVSAVVGSLLLKGRNPSCFKIERNR